MLRYMDAGNRYCGMPWYTSGTGIAALSAVPDVAAEPERIPPFRYEISLIGLSLGRLLGFEKNWCHSHPQGLLGLSA